MPITSAQLAKQAIQELIDMVAVDGMPTDAQERREILRLLAKSESWIPTHCPETGVDLATHSSRVAAARPLCHLPL